MTMTMTTDLTIINVELSSFLKRATSNIWFDGTIIDMSFYAIVSHFDIKHWVRTGLSMDTGTTWLHAMEYNPLEYNLTNNEQYQ